MTDKQIIIDVCPYQGECSVSGCKRNDDGCFVRQLFEERYRAENQIVELNKTIKAKEQECEELKRQRQADKGLITATGKQNYQLLQEYDKLKTALTEIKEIAERDKEFCIKCNGNKEIDCVDCIEGGRALLAKEILQKISECEEQDGN